MVSSTFTDLVQHRAKIIEAIQKLDFHATVMENSGANAVTDVIDTSLRMVSEAAAYICVISRKYGQTPECPTRNADGLSITELEFNEAMRLNRPRLLFIMGEKHPLIEADVELDEAKRTKLKAFRERAKRMTEVGKVNCVYEEFDSVEEFSIKAAIAVGRLAQILNPLGQETTADPTRPKPSGAISNIPIAVPLHFLGRDDDLAAIDSALRSKNGRVAITALHGLRGVGKTVLAAAYAERHRDAYRATWWIRAETESTMRADLVGLGVQLGWVSADDKEEPALAIVLQRLRDDGRGLLLIYDNAIDANAIRPYVQRAGESRLIVTSNAPNWGGLAEPVEIEVWPKEVGADFLTARVGRSGDREAALTLSDALGGLPLAHEQAAAYCERTGVPFSEYLKRFNQAPAKLLDAGKDAPTDYHDRLTVAKTFALAIDEAAKLHPAAEPLITYAALLAPEPIPLLLFAEAREEFAEPFASAVAGDGLDEAVAALRAYALIDREAIADERDPTIETDCIRLHRLVREVAIARVDDDVVEDFRRRLIEATAAIYPRGSYSNPKVWPRARRLDAIALALADVDPATLEGSESAASYLLNEMALYRDGCLAAYGAARTLAERSLSLNEVLFGPDHPATAASLNNLASLLDSQGDLAGAKPYYERALAINEKALRPDHPDTATSLSNLGYLLVAQGDLAGAKPYVERALAIREKALGPEHPDTANSLNNLGGLLLEQGDLTGAKPYVERALAIHEEALGSDHPGTANSLNNLGGLLQAQGDLAGAKPYIERALAIREEALGPDHPDTANSLNNLGGLLREQGDLVGARPYLERALAIYEKVLGPGHPTTKIVAHNLAAVLAKLG